MTEPVILILMIVTFMLVSLVLRWPPALATALAAVVGALVAGNGFPVRHLVEGMFCYFDVMLVIATAMIFMKSLERAGIIDQIARSLYSRFSCSTSGLLLTSALLVMCPGMITGSSTAAALTTGGLVAPVLIEYGFSRATAGSLIAMWSILGMVAPPVNIPAMIMGGGVDMPFVGFDLPLLVMTAVIVLITVAFGYLWGGRDRMVGAGRGCVAGAGRGCVAGAGRGCVAGAGRGYNTLAGPTGPKPTEPAGLNGPAGLRNGAGLPGTLLFGLLPIFVVLALIMGPRLWPLQVPDLGMPLAFMIGAILAAVIGTMRQGEIEDGPLRSEQSVVPGRPPIPARPAIRGRFDIIGTWQEGVTSAIPVMGILAAAGTFIQIMTLTGARGYVVSLALSIPGLWRYVAAGLALPALGAISSYASSSVLGVPFLLAMLGRNDIIMTSAMSLVVAIGDVLPPVAIVPSLITQSMGESPAFRFEVIRRSGLSILAVLATGIIVMWQARLLGEVLVR